MGGVSYTGSNGVIGRFGLVGRR